MTRLHKSLAMALLLGGGTPALAQLQPLDVQGIQSQGQAAIQQQNLSTQLGTLRVEQGVAQDRIREFDLFRPQQPYGATTYFQPQPPGLAPLPQQPVLPPPPPPPKPAPPAP